MGSKSKKKREVLQNDQGPVAPPVNETTPKNSPSREEYLMLAVILLVGLLLRFAYFQDVKQLPDFDHPIMDAGFKDAWARTILTGESPQRPGVPEVDLKSTPYIRPPLYPFFMAAVYLFTGESYAALRIVQHLLGLVSVVLLYLLGRSLFGRVVALIGAAFMATYWVFIYFESELNAPALIVFLLLLFFNLLRGWIRQPTTRRAVWPGLVLGLLALIRPETLLMLPVVVVWGAIVLRGGSRPANYKALAVMMLVVVLTIAPVTLRNYLRSGEFVPICTIGGLNLYAGNNPEATGSFPVLDYRELFGINETLSHHNFPQLIMALEKKTGQENLDYSDLESYFVSQALDHISHHPLDTLQLMVRKTLLYWGPWEVSSNKVLYFDKQDSLVLRYLPGFPFVAGLFALGIAMWCVRRRAVAGNVVREDGDQRNLLHLLLLFIAVSFATHLIFFVVGRFRVPVIPVMLLFGAYGVHGIYQLCIARNWKVAGGWAAAGMALILFFHIPLVSYHYDLPLWHLQRGTTYGEKGLIDKAIEELQTAIDVGGTAPWYYSDLGFAYFNKGDYIKAAELYEEALDIDPQWTDAAYKLGLVKFRQEKYDEAIEAFDDAIAGNFTATAPRLDRVLALTQLGRHEEAEQELTRLREMGADLRDFSFRLGYLAAAEGRTEDAIGYFRKAIEENPESAAAYNYLGYELAKLGDLEGAEENYRKATDLSPYYAAAYNNLGNLYAHRELYDEATIFYASALESDPENVDSNYGLGYVYYQVEEYYSAIEYFRRATVIQPDYADAHNYLGLALMKTNAPLDNVVGAFRRAIEANPDLVLARNNLGDAYRKGRRLDKALETFEETLSRWPNNAYAQEQAVEIRREMTLDKLRGGEKGKVVIIPGRK